MSRLILTPHGASLLYAWYTGTVRERDCLTKQFPGDAKALEKLHANIRRCIQTRALGAGSLLEGLIVGERAAKNLARTIPALVYGDAHLKRFPEGTRLLREFTALIQADPAVAPPSKLVPAAEEYEPGPVQRKDNHAMLAADTSNAIAAAFTKFNIEIADRIPFADQQRVAREVGVERGTVSAWLADQRRSRREEAATKNGAQQPEAAELPEGVRVVPYETDNSIPFVLSPEAYERVKDYANPIEPQPEEQPTVTYVKPEELIPDYWRKSLTLLLGMGDVTVPLSHEHLFQAAEAKIQSLIQDVREADGHGSVWQDLALKAEKKTERLEAELKSLREAEAEVLQLAADTKTKLEQERSRTHGIEQDRYQVRLLVADIFHKIFESEGLNTEFDVAAARSTILPALEILKPASAPTAGTEADAPGPMLTYGEVAQALAVASGGSFYGNSDRKLDSRERILRTAADFCAEGLRRCQP